MAHSEVGKLSEAVLLHLLLVVTQLELAGAALVVAKFGSFLTTNLAAINLQTGLHGLWVSVAVMKPEKVVSSILRLESGAILVVSATTSGITVVDLVLLERVEAECEIPVAIVGEIAGCVTVVWEGIGSAAVTQG